MYVICKGQKISEANYGVLNSSKKRTKSEKEFDPTTLGPFFQKQIRSFFGRIEGVVNWFSNQYQIVINFWISVCERLLPKLLSLRLAKKPKKFVLQKSFFSLTAIAFR